MSQAQKSDRTLMKQANQSLVLQLIQSRGPISRKDVATISGLSPASVTGITGELIERGLVHEVGEAEGDGRAGRRAVLLRLNPHAGFVVGVKLATQSVDCVLTDLDANVLRAASTPLPDHGAAAQTAYAPATMIQVTIAAIEQLLSATQIARGRLLGIGIGVNGIVDSAKGISHFAPHYGWRNVPLADPIAAHFGIPVYLENDARTLTIAEQWFGAARGVEHFAAIAVGYGIGAGVVTNGQIYRGALGGAGEFGHMVIQPDGPPCSCGRRGCIESLAAAPAMMRQIEAALAEGEPSVLAQIERLSLRDVAAAADSGDDLAQRVLSTAGRWLGVGVASVVNILNPQLLIITGEAVQCGRWYFEPMETTLRAMAFDGLADTLTIHIEPAGNDMWARGAACVVLNALFTSPIHHPQPQFNQQSRALALF
ncbi:MAG: ROK family transcriptional regulator [Chloroflexi bacterium]|nr:ROK family transcriptional regulator [Chloroflexota bacterium]